MTVEKTKGINSQRLSKEFYTQDALVLAPRILGKKLVRRFDDGTILSAVITEVEIYRGEEDLACHARKGRTSRTEVMYYEGGFVYVYLIYGMYWLLNIVTGPSDHPQAILIRALDLSHGPGRVGRVLRLDKSFYGEDLSVSNRLWLEYVSDVPFDEVAYSERVGVDYAGEWSRKLWRFSFPA